MRARATARVLRVNRAATSRIAGALALLVILLAGLALNLAADLMVTLPVLLTLVAGSVWAHRHGPGQLRDATILVALLWVVLAVPWPLLWPGSGVLALVLAGLWAWRRGHWPQWRQWLRVGRIDPVAWAMCGVIALLSVVGLLTWNRLLGGELAAGYSDLVQGVPTPVAVIAILLFLVVNGAIEDSIWSGVLLSAGERLLPPWLAMGAAALSFGLAHLHGVPDGVVGVVMAGSWGLVLGFLRMRTGGMVATYVAHIVADTTIVLMLLPTLLQG